MKYAGFVARLLAGALLVFSGVYKAAGAPEEFAIIIRFYSIVPDPLVMGLSAMLPWIELFVGFSLIFGYFNKAAAGAALGLFSAFFLALISTKIRGIDLPNCGCFGGGLHIPIWATTFLDAGLIALSALAFRHGEQLCSLDKWAQTRH